MTVHHFDTLQAEPIEPAWYPARRNARTERKLAGTLCKSEFVPKVSEA
jgi:hypothetical protein